jgi:phosphoribosylamine--glycine ligase
MNRTAQVAIVMGSDSDFPVMKDAVDILKKFDIPFEVAIASAHRSPEKAVQIAETAASRGIKVIIAGAGHAAHLAGAMAAHTTLPIIGVPIDSSCLKGLDALLSTVQMPPGIPVATVSIGKPGAKNAAILAAQIISLFDPSLSKMLAKYKDEMAEEIERKNKKVADYL